MVLITGAGGWLGTELTRQLLEKQKKVRAFNFIETEGLKKLKEKYPKQLEIVVGDVCDKKKIAQAFQEVDCVYHLAAKVHVMPTSQEEEKQFYKVNTQASDNIFKECILRKVKRIVFFSTVSVYQHSKNLINVNSKKEPNTVYGKSKLEAEKIANKLYLENNLPITIIEPVTVYGEGDVGNFRKLEDLIQKGFSVRIGNGQNKKTVIYYKDLIAMTIKIAEDESNIGKTIICGTEILTINEINQILIKKVNKKIVKIFIPKWLANVTKRICCFSILKKLRRQVEALMQNSEFEINNPLERYTKFEEYQLRNEKYN